MPATPADIAKYTSDGVLLTDQSTAIRDANPGAQDLGDGELDTFFDTAAAGQAMLDERFAFLSQVIKPHEAIEVQDLLGLGSVIPVTPALPQIVVIDASRGINTNTLVRGYSFDMTTDRYAIELVGYTRPVMAGHFTFDSTVPTFDTTGYTFDAS